MRVFITALLPVLTLTLPMIAQTNSQLDELWEKEHVTKILPSNVRHRDLKIYLDGLRSRGVKVAEAGRSVLNKEIYQIEWGNGPLRVFLWSQMHGDEPTATSALIDLFTILQKNRDADWAKRIASAMTIRAVPMLNPDGADMFLRRNTQGLDINRDAIDQRSPEALLLKKLRDDWSPQIGFNLHNQNGLTSVGSTPKQAAISFLVVYGDEPKTSNPGHERNRRLAAEMIEAIGSHIPGHIARYDDEFTPTAFGDNFSAWGTPTILIETGALQGKSEMFLVKMNFIAIAAALRALADGSERERDPGPYDNLPPNSSGRIINFIFQNASIIDPAAQGEPARGNIAVALQRRRAEFPTPGVIRRIGDTGTLAGLEEYDASEFNVAGRFELLKPGAFAELLFYKKGRTVDWAAPDLERAFPPDAIFSLGKWVKGEGVVPRKK
ncbi:MAG: peptidase M14 [Chloracidobacterium sp.]|nr:peptidase M14 [Chloracidobacterium sp.]